jgi:excisionase family DNA binding protein
MTIDIVTKQDLHDFKSEILAEIHKLANNQPKTRKWLKSPEVKEILGCSDSTLQNLRHNGTLEFARVGGTVYYPYDAIMKLFERTIDHSKQHNPKSN